MKKKLLHRDISIGNLAYEMVNGRPVIIILDFELATVVGDKVRTNEVRTGTAPFMAREVLKGFESGYTHTLNHDLESVYYIAYWHVVGYRGYELPAKDYDPLKSWWSGSFEEMRKAKEEHMSLPVQSVTELLKKLKRDAKSIEILRITRVRFSKRAGKSDIIKIVHEAKKDSYIEAVRMKALEDGLPEEEQLALVNEKLRELTLEGEPRWPTLAISFAEWLENEDLFFPEDVEDCECESCSDDFSGRR